MSIKNDESSAYKKWTQVGLWGGFRAIIGAPIEYPLDCVKTRWQASPEIRDLRSVITTIYKERGFRGFYAGALPKTAHNMIEQGYRFPLVISVPRYYKKLLPDDFQNQFQGIEKPLTGITLASLESLVVTPFERLKVWHVTRQKKSPNFFDKNNNTWIARELFRGTKVVYTKSLVSWTTFLTADHFFKEHARRNSPNKTLTPLSLAGVSLSVGVVCTGVVLPIDVVKTQMQKADPTKHKGVVKTLHHIFKKHGLRGVMIGWPIKISTSMLQVALTVTMLEKINEQL